MSDMKDALAAKRAKLALLKQKREERKKLKQQSIDSKAAPPQPANVFTPPQPGTATDVLSDVDKLIGAGPTVTSIDEKQEFKRQGNVNLALSNVQTLDFPPVPPPVKYDQFTQAGDEPMEDDTQEDEDAKQRQLAQELMRQKREQEKRQKEEQLRKELDEEERKRMQLTREQQQAIFESRDFADFFSRSSLLVERALYQNSRFDLAVDYTKADDDEEKKGSNMLNLVHTFTDPKARGKEDRPVTSIDWSPFFSSLLLCSYGVSPDFHAEKGLVHVWDNNLPTRPSLSFVCQSTILSAMFHPTDSHIIIGATESGQIVQWDTRGNKKTPITLTSLSNGHTHPVYALSSIPSSSVLHNIVSASTDGRVCVWGDNDLVQPSNTIPFEQDKQEKAIYPSTKTVALRRGRSLSILGSDEGALYKIKLFDDPGVFEVISNAHDGPITQVQFHPAHKGDSQIEDLFLTASYDWSCKLWSSQKEMPILHFDTSNDYVYDIQWSPQHPALFVSADGAGTLDFWDLGKDHEVPVVSEKPLGDDSPAINRVKWSRDGKQLAIGDSRGEVTVFDVSDSISEPSKDTVENFFNMLQERARHSY